MSGVGWFGGWRVVRVFVVFGLVAGLVPSVVGASLSAVSAPTGVSVSSTDVSVSVSWVVPAQSGVYLDEMFLERVMDDGDGGWSVASSVEVAADWALDAQTSWSHKVKGLASGTQYWFRVRLDTTGHGDAYSEVVSATTQTEPPVAPSGLSASVGDDGAVGLSWSVPAQPGWVGDDGVGSMRLERRDSYSFAAVGQVDWASGTTGYSFTDDTASRGLLYEYRVRLLAGGRWLYSGVVEVTVPALVESGAGPLSGFSLIDASDQSLLGSLVDGETMELSDPGTGDFTVRADVAAGESVGSVFFELTGPVTATRTESWAPFALHGDNGSDDLHGGGPLPVGDYTLTATAYSSKYRRGDTLGTLAVSFTIAAAAGPGQVDPKQIAPGLLTRIDDPGDGEQAAYADFSLSRLNREPQGMWSDGSTMWVVDWTDDWVYAYTLSDGSRAPDKEIDLHSDQTSPHGIWSDGTTVWVGDSEDEKLYAYVLADGSRDSDKDLSLEAGIKPEGFWSNGTTMWIVDYFDEIAYAYSWADGVRDSAKDITLYSDHLLAVHNDAWSDGTTLWVAEWTEGELYAFTLSDQLRHPGLDLDTSDELGIDEPGGVWSNGTTMWVLDYGNHRVRVIDKPAVGQPGRPESGPLAGFSLVDASSQQVLANLVDGASVAVGDPDGGSYAIRADIVEGGIVGSVSLELSGAKNVPARTENIAPYSLYGDRPNRWFRDLDGGSLPVGDYTLTATVYSKSGLRGIVHGTLEVSFAVTLDENDDEQDEPAEYSGFVLDLANRSPNGMWSDGVTMWVVNSSDDRLYAYSLADGTRTLNKDIHLHSGHTSPTGIWSDGTTVWVGDSEDEKLYAYVLADGSRDSDKDLSLEAGIKPEGFWSNGTTMWIVDYFDEIAYAYSWADGVRDSAKDITLYSDHLLAVHNDAWSDGTTLWVAEWTEGELYAYTLSDQSRNPGLDLDTSDELGIDEPGGVWSNGTTMWVLDYGNHRVRVIDKPAVG